MDEDRLDGHFGSMDSFRISPATHAKIMCWKIEKDIAIYRTFGFHQCGASSGARVFVASYGVMVSFIGTLAQSYNCRLCYVLETKPHIEPARLCRSTNPRQNKAKV